MRKAVYLYQRDSRVYFLPTGKKGVGALESMTLDSDDTLSIFWDKVNSFKMDVIEIRDIQKLSLQGLTLPAKSFEQLDLMLPHQVKRLDGSSGKSSYEVLRMADSEANHKSCLLVRFKKEDSSGFYDADQFKGKNWYGLSLYSAIILRFLSYAKGEDLDVLYQEESVLFHLIIRTGELTEARVTLFDVDGMDASELSRFLEEQYRVTHQSIPSSLLTNIREKDGFSETLSLMGISLKVSRMNQERETETEDLLASVASGLADETCRPCVIAGKKESMGSRRPSPTFAMSLVVMGLSFLVITWLTGYMKVQQYSDYSDRLNDGLKKLHTLTLEPGKRRHFSEISFIKRLRKDADGSKDDSNESLTFRHIMSELQNTLMNCPGFICHRIQVFPQSRTFKVQGVIDDVRSFDVLSQEFEKNADWIVNANFTRSSGSVKGLKVNLNVEVEK